MSDITSVYQTIKFNKGVKNLFYVCHDYNIWERQFTYPGHGQLYHPSGWDWRLGMPALFWLYGKHKTELNKSWQITSFETNPGMNPKKWRILWDWMRAWSNGLGFGFDTRNLFMRALAIVRMIKTEDEVSIMGALNNALSAYVPVQDFVNNRDIKAGVPLLTKDKVRIACGHTFEGEKSGDMVAVKTFDANNDSPQEKWMIDNPGKTIEAFIDVHKYQFMHAVSTAGRGDNPAVAMFPQNDGRRCLVPLMAIREVTFPLGALQPVTEFQNPYVIQKGI